MHSSVDLSGDAHARNVDEVEVFKTKVRVSFLVIDEDPKSSIVMMEKPHMIAGFKGATGIPRRLCDETGLAGGSTVIFFVTGSMARMVVRNNILRDTRAQGILVQTRHVVVEGNTFEGIAGPAVKVALSLNDWYESVATGNILIRRNTFRRSSLSVRKSHELIYIDQRNDGGEAVSVIDSVRIEGNQIEQE